MFQIYPLIFAAFIFSSEASFGGSYSFSQTVLSFDNSPSSVGYKLTGKLNLQRHSNEIFLCELQDLQLHVRSSKVSPEGFVKHDSKIDKFINNPFAIELYKGDVKNIYISSAEDSTMVNIKRGIASLFQFKQSNDKFEESDMSGVCQVDYKMIGNHISKKKFDCHWPGEKYVKSRLWGTKIDSKRFTEIALDKENFVDHIAAQEEHKLLSTWNEIMQLKMTTNTDLKIIDKKIVEKSSDVEAIQKDLRVVFKKYNFDVKAKIKSEEIPFKLSKFVKVNSKTIEEEIGTSKSAWMFIKGVKSVRNLKSTNVHEYLSKKNQKEAVEQVLDILGSTPNSGTHKAVMQFLQSNKDNPEVDFWDRYLWALSMSPQPPLFIIEDLFKLAENRHEEEKIWQTIVLTVPAVVYRYTQQNPSDERNPQLIQKAINFLAEELRKCEEEDVECQRIYLRAFVNIPSPEAINNLLLFKKVYNKKLIVEIMNALQKINAEHWNAEVIELAEEIYLGNATYDSTARVIALNMLLESKLSDDVTLMKILSVLTHDDISRELQQYLLVSLEQMYQKHEGLERKVLRFLRDNKRNNYNAQALSGFSTRFDRAFMNGGRLSTIQEIVNGVLRSGVVDVQVFTEEYEKTPFSLGLFSKGLSSLMSSGGDEESEVVTAGMQLRIMDVSLRPFVFFNGNGELMGHVFSGTASTLTPAYQALVLLDDDNMALPLGIGHNAQVSFLSGASVDLSGQTELSLWHKTGKTLVKNKAGLAFEGKMGLNLPFVSTEVEFNLHATPELLLSSALNFYDGIAMCLQLEQPKSLIRYNTYKVERIVESKHKVRKSRGLTIPAAGRSFALNRMNNAMCNVLAKQGWFDDGS